MKEQENSAHVLMQGHKARMSQQQPSLACLIHRSLSSGLCQPRFERSGFASLRLCVRWLVFLLSLLSAAFAASIPVTAQEVEETIKIKTRVVFLDALVKDKKTGIPISNLAVENFEVLDEGKPRAVSYFTREGQARKPLALVLILDLRDDGAGRFLKRPEILKLMANELAKLPSEDEVAILAINMNSETSQGSVIRDGKGIWLCNFTKDRTQIAAAFSRVPSLIEVPETAEQDKGMEDSGKNPSEQRKGSSMTISADTEKKAADTPTEPQATAQQPKPEDIVKTETIKGKNGAVITRTEMKDGSINVKRVNSSGHVTVELDDVYDMAGAVRDAAQYTSKERPNSQASIVWVSDGIAPIFYEDRDATEQLLIRDNVTFSSLTVELRTLFKFLLPFAKPVGNWMGMSLYGSAKRMAQQTGGEAVRVSREKDYGVGLSKIVGNLTARYSLGFTLEEAEKDDGRLHGLEVKVKAQDEKGKTRKLNVNARKGYYMATNEKDSTASTTQPATKTP
jgi:VWFA-related protein